MVRAVSLQQRGEVARQRRHDQHLGPAGVDGVAQVVAHEALQRAEGLAVHRHLAHRHLALADRTESMPNDGLWCVSRSRENTSQAAASLRVAGVCSGA